MLFHLWLSPTYFLILHKQRYVQPKNQALTRSIFLECLISIFQFHIKISLHLESILRYLQSLTQLDKQVIYKHVLKVKLLLISTLWSTPS